MDRPNPTNLIGYRVLGEDGRLGGGTGRGHQDGRVGELTAGTTSHDHPPIGKIPVTAR